MTKFAISPEGAESLRLLSTELTKSVEEITRASDVLELTRFSLSDELGIYDEELSDLIRRCE